MSINFRKISTVIFHSTICFASKLAKHLEAASSNLLIISPVLSACVRKQVVSVFARCAPAASRTTTRISCPSPTMEFHVVTHSFRQPLHFNICKMNYYHCAVGIRRLSQSLLMFSATLREQLYPRICGWGGLSRRHCSPGGTTVGLWRGPGSAPSTLTWGYRVFIMDMRKALEFNMSPRDSLM